MSDLLSSLRENLHELTFSTLSILEQRQKLVLEIAQTKPKNELYWMFDPQREYQYFKSIEEKLRPMDDHELLMFSLILESHAWKASESYPRWSMVEHLINPAQSPLSMANPILVKLLKPNAFSKLSLKPEFSFLGEL